MGRGQRLALAGTAILALLVAVAIWLADDHRDAAGELSTPTAPASDPRAMDLKLPDTVGAPDTSAPLEVPALLEPAPASAAARDDDAEPARAILLRVLAPDETPIEGALGRLTARRGQETDEDTLAEALADADGRMRLEPSRWPELGVDLKVTADGFSSVGMGGTSWSANEFDVTLRWMAPVAGVVRDAETGAPIEGAWVRGEREVLSDADGRFATAVTTGWKSTLTVEHLEYASAHESFTLHGPETHTVDITLQRGLVVRPMVVDRHTGEPLADVAVKPSQRAEPFAHTDGAGRFFLRVLPGEPRDVVLARDDHVLLQWHWDGTGATADMDLRVPLLGHGWISGRVTDEDGQPLADVNLYAESRGFYHEPVDPEVLARHALPGTAYDVQRLEDPPPTDADGFFRVAVAPVAEPYTLHARRDGLVRAESPPLELTRPGDERRIEIVMHAGGRVHGRVTRNSAALAHVEVKATFGEDGFAGRTYGDADGHYALGDLPPGAVTLVFSDMSSDAELARDEVLIAAGADLRHDVELVEEVGTIAGRVIWSDGRPAADRTVSATPQGSEDSRHGRTDGDGRFEVEVPVGVLHDVSVYGDISSAGVEAVAVGRDDLELVLAARGFLELTVVDALTGEPVRAAGDYAFHGWVQWRTRPDEPFRRARSPTAPPHPTLDVHGRVRLIVPAGRLELLVDLGSEGYVPRTLPDVVVPPEPAEATLDVALQPGAALKLRFVDDATGEPGYPGQVLWFVPAHQRQLVRTPAAGETASMSFGGGNGTRVKVDDPTLAKRWLRVDGEGRAEAAALTPGPWVLLPFPGGLVLQPDTIDVPYEGEQPVEVRFAPGGG